MAKGVCYGATDLGLATTFDEEVQAVLTGLPEVSCILCSPLQRCLRLAQRLGVHLSLEPQVTSDWREMDFGRWEGVPWAEVPRAELDGWAADFRGYDGHGGESVAALYARVERAMQEAPEGALIVTHMGCIKAALVVAGDEKGWDSQLPFGGIVQL